MAEKIVNCLFLKNIQSERNPEEELQKAFRIFDDDDTGKITAENLRKIATEIYPGNVTDAEVEEMIRIADLNQDGGVDYQEFIDLMKRAKLI